MKSIFLFSISIVLPFVMNAQEKIDPSLTEVWEPVPAVVTPGNSKSAPSDAIVLFDGTNLDQWQNPQNSGEPESSDDASTRLSKLNENFKHQDAGWILENGEMIVNPGNGAIETVRKFDDFQLHIEWMSPVDEGKEGQAYSNSGIFLMSLYEVQVLNSYENKTYPNGQASSIYKQHIPLVNASLPPGQWQVYDIIFTAPVFDENKKLKTPAYVTVFHNGVLVQNHVEIKGPTVYRGEPKYVYHPSKMPLRLQDHNDKVRFKNIWIREL